ncbi:Ig-like domain-containing protein [Pleomorphovibrio marinus]|uniref:Ig-like domain-containing protein n=1 Tax=Pleomorphovibrio marinus TaxID=2164132 RepID=UPI000E0B26DB|nr:gliding motility-associated C-terminal domain-containing protein [Pleomorphovibrio marinus]
MKDCKNLQAGSIFSRILAPLIVIVLTFCFFQHTYGQEETVTVTADQNNVPIAALSLDVGGVEIIQESPTDNENPAPFDVPALINYLQLEDGRKIFATTRRPNVANPNPLIGSDEIRPEAVQVVRYNDVIISHRDPEFLENLEEVVSTPDLRSYWDIDSQPSIPEGAKFVDLIYPDQVVSSGFILYTERFGNSATDFIALDRNGEPIEGAKRVEVRGWQWDSGVNHMTNVPDQTQWMALFSPRIFESGEPIFGIRIISVDEPDGKLVFFVNALNASDDRLERVNSEVGGEALLNVFENDELNGFPLSPIDIEFNILEPFPENTVILNDDGTVDVPPNTEPGNYTATYQLVTPDGQSDEAVVFVQVIEFKPEAFDLEIELEDSFGRDSVMNVLENDFLNGLPADPEDVILSQIENQNESFIVLNPDGSIDIIEGIPAGTYQVIYQICDREDQDKCDQATVTIIVAETVLEAIDDDFGLVNLNRQGPIGDVIANDLINGDPVSSERVFVELVDSDGLQGIELTPEGVLIIPEGLSEGEYLLTYDLIETINPSNRSRGSITFELADLQFLAVDDEISTGQNQSIAIEVLANDVINDDEVTIATLTVLDGPSQGATTVNPDGTITYQPDTNFTGEDQFTYQICDDEDGIICDQAMVTITVMPIQLEITKEANELDVPVGGMVSFTILLTNNSEFDLEDILVDDQLPAGLMFLSSEPEPSNGNEWAIDQLPSGQSTSIQIETMAVSVGEFINQVAVTIGDYTDQASSLPVNVIARPVDLAIEKTSFDLEIYEGNEFPYEITITNMGNTTAEQIQLVDELPNGVTFIDFQSEGFAGEASVSNGTVTWVVPVLEPEETLSFTINVLAVNQGVISNTVTLTVDEDQVLISPENQATDTNQIRVFFIPNVITPGTLDGKNDTFVINGIQRFASHKLTIMNRNGDHVYESENYQNDWAAEGLNGGSYYYVLEIMDSQGNDQRYKGWVQVIK